MTAPDTAPSLVGGVGYYVHHVGHGHLHRALALREELLARGQVVTALSSLPAVAGVPWVRLPADDDGAPPVDPTAGGRLHWAPLRHAGLRDRTAAISAWITRCRPSVIVSDVSQEVTLLARLHGIPVVSVVQPGRREDPAHVLGFDVAQRLVGFWPSGVRPAALPAHLAARVEPLGAMSRFAPGGSGGRDPGGPVVVLGGSGGATAWTTTELERLQAAARREVVVLGHGGDWVDDPDQVLRGASVAVVQAGQNAVAEVAAARVPAVVVPARRPHDEQDATAATLAGGPFPVVVLPTLRHHDWPRLLDRVAALDGRAWASWCDGGAARRFADVVLDVVGVPEVVA